MSDAAVGQCADCGHASRVTSDRGARFWLCRLAARNPDFVKYPPLPVLGCPGYEPVHERE